jgi:ubiquinone/menaquinone biosynthesis C-methylase UbiE
LLTKRGRDITFMNYGFAALDETGADGSEAAESIDDRFSQALYHRVAAARDLRGKDVLEVGCGRGGGSAYVARCLGPRSVVGIDFYAGAVRFCRQRHQAPGLTFQEGNAEQLPFDAATFDAVLNVESSHCYPSFERFVHEVARVLRPGGYFLFADLRVRSELPAIREQLASVFAIAEEERMTPNVFRALQLSNARRQALIRAEVPAILRRAVRNFVAVEGTVAFDALRSGDLEYVRFVLQRRDGSVQAA